METKNHKKGVMRVVKEITLVFVVFLCCFPSRGQESRHKKEYIIEAYKSVDANSSYLTLQTFDFEDSNEKLFVFYHVNNIILNEKLTHENKISVNPGKFQINALYPGKITTELMLQVDKGDSIRVKFYMRDDLTPLHPEGAPDIVIPQKNN
ncbi:hypothetical protein [Flagellimonas baculiformis]|uniref:hypothetical protein n=1 Tax=Flagellimonas baculiformis TaxID=3067310 RepID=UPI00296E86E6|nr:hypothetical protein [Muricauda sp. D6]